jgi:hypothetical protein
MASNKVLHFKSDSARSLVEKYDKSFEVQDVHLIGDIESFPRVEPCINLHQSVGRLASVLILGTLSSKRVLCANEPNVKSWFGGAFLEAKQVISVLRSSSAGLFVPGTASNWGPRRLTRQWMVFNSTTFRDVDGRPVRWISSVKQLEASRSLLHMWVDKDYRYVEVQFRVSGSDRLNVGGVAFDTWVVSHRDPTTGYWTAERNYSTGFKEDSLEHDQTCGLLLRDAYHGIYGMKTREG